MIMDKISIQIAEQDAVVCFQEPNLVLYQYGNVLIIHSPFSISLLPTLLNSLFQSVVHKSINTMAKQY